MTHFDFFQGKQKGDLKNVPKNQLRLVYRHTFLKKKKHYKFRHRIDNHKT